MTAYETFRQLHFQSTPLLLGNLWDVNSAAMFEAAGYQAVGTSSMAVARALGYDDGENIPFEWLLQLAGRVTKKVSLPVTVDVEAGYGRTADAIADNMLKLHDAGVVGVNFEDTVPGATRALRPASEFQKLLGGVADKLAQRNANIFINVRTDGFLLGLGNALQETLQRIPLYEAAGATGLFVPCITAPSDISSVVAATKLPLNVMCMPQLPGFDELASLGVKRISFGPFLNNYVNKKTEEAMRAVAAQKNFSLLF